MFCGIVDHSGLLESIEQKPKGVLFRVRSEFTDLVLGESIAVDGVCLTVAAYADQVFECELSPETLVVSIAGQYQVGQVLNLERAMRMNDRIGGHLVTGHVDGTILVERKIKQADFIELSFLPENTAYLVPKGSVTINGVSLTVNRVNEHNFSVMLIPHTLERTNLSALEPGQRVNVEWDYMAKLVERRWFNALFID